jgi:hypothetical protein
MTRRGAAGGQQPKCPACGSNRFQWKEKYRECNGCGALGWLGQDSPGGAGSGKTCHQCQRATLHRVVEWEDEGTEVRRCTGCGAVVLNFEA